MDLCSFLLSVFVLKAYEFTPGLMRVNVLDTRTETVHELIVETNEYLTCWENNLSV